MPQAVEAEAGPVQFELAVAVAGLSSPGGVVKTIGKRNFVF